MKPSFLENIIYWLWLYSKRLGAYFPFKTAEIVLALLLLSNLMPVAIIAFLGYMLICSEMNIPPLILDSEKIATGLVLSYVIVVSYVMLRYKDKKYCTVRRQGVWVWSEKYCILTDYYDNITPKQIQKCRKTFYIYLVVSILTTIISIILLLLYMNYYK